MEPEAQPDGAGAAPAAETPKYITEEQLDGILTTRLRASEQRLEKTFTQSIVQSFDAFTGKLKGEIASLLPAPKVEGMADPKRSDAAPDPELKKLQDQVTSLTRDAEEARSQRDAERAKVQDATLRQRVGEILASAGVEGVRARHAIGLLVDAEKRVRWSGDGESIVFRAPDREDAELEPGLRAWLKSEDARLYLPPKGSQGSGDRPGAGGPVVTAGGSPDRREVADGLRRALLGQI